MRILNMFTSRFLKFLVMLTGKWNKISNCCLSCPKHFAVLLLRLCGILKELTIQGQNEKKLFKKGKHLKKRTLRHLFLVIISTWQKRNLWVSCDTCQRLQQMQKGFFIPYFTTEKWGGGLPSLMMPL
jgi:hypothetical protein